MRTHIIACLVILVIAGAAWATPTGTIIGSYNSTGWVVWAWCSTGDNDGFAALCFKVGNVATAQCNAPVATSDGTAAGPAVHLGTYGFSGRNTAFRDLTIPNQYEIVTGVEPGDIMSASPYVVRHMGQELLSIGYNTHIYIPPSTNYNFPCTLFIPDNPVTDPGSSYTSAPGHPSSFQVASGTLINPGDIPTFVWYWDESRNPMTPLGFCYIGLGENASHSPTNAEYLAGAGTATWLPEPGTLALTAFAGAALVLRRLKRSPRSRES